MEDFIFSMVMVAIGLMIWAAIGHAIWMVCAKVIVALLGTRCQRCGRKSLHDSECRYCASHPAGSVTAHPSVQDDLSAARRLLQFSKFKQWLSDEQHDSLAGLLERLSRRLADNVEARRSLSPHKQAEAVPRESDPGPLTAEQSLPGLDRGVQPRPTTPQPGLVEATVVKSPAVTSDISENFHQTSAASDAQIHPLDAPDEPVVVREARQPIAQRVTADLLKSFMEQSNIRWIELISAALIVVCSVGLVISLWSTLSNTSRFFPSLVFLLATAAVHGAGQYTLRQWKLRSTSRGILQIGLMLIPLAVLVGILLARRDEGPLALDAMAVMGTVGGIVVYGFLAVTASRALFPRRWWLVAAVSAVSSVSLLPTYYVAEKSLLLNTTSALILLPMLLTSMWAALTMSQSIVRHARLTYGTAKRVAGIVTQCCFAAGVVAVFWIIESRSSGGLSVTWWLSVGLLSAAWASWGWTISLGDLRGLSFKSSTQVTSAIRSDASWLRVAAWCLACLCTVLLLAAIWQTSANRAAVSGLLGCAAVWWLLHGWACRLRLSLMTGALAAILSFTLGSEALYADSVGIRIGDWLSLTRIATLTASGLVVFAVGRWLTSFHTQRESHSRLQPFARERRQPLSVAQIGLQFAIAGSLAVAGSAVLTIMASLVPWGPTPYGGNWAALLLMSFGLVASAGSVLIVASQANIDRRMSWLMPAGQAVLLLGTIRLFQTSPMLDQPMASLRPARAWGVGMAVLAAAWALSAAAVSVLNRARLSQRLNIRWLCGVALAVALVSVPAVWNWPERFHLAANLGWYLPLTFFSVFIAWRPFTWGGNSLSSVEEDDAERRATLLRHSSLREISLLSLCGWLSTLLVWVGHQHAWWSTLELPTSCAVFALLAVFTIIVWEFAVENLRRQTQASIATLSTLESRLDYQQSEDLLPPTPQVAPAIDWAWAGPYWASPILLSLCWIMTWMTLTPVVIAGLKASLDAALVSTEQSPPQLSGMNGAVLLSLGIALTVVGSWLGWTRRQWWLVNMGALLPVLTAMIAAGFSSPPYALTAALWALSAWILASELLRLRSRGSQYSTTAWQQLIAQDVKLSPEQVWLPLARAAAVGLLLLGTAVFVSAAYVGQLPAELSPENGLHWISNVRLALLTVGPALLVMIVRWSLSVVAGESPRMITVSGVLVAVLAGCVGSLGLTPSWPSSAIVFLQVAGLVAAGLAWTTLIIATLRNLLGLKKLLGAQASWRQLLPKAMKGNRWKQSEQASWSLIWFALTGVFMLNLGAALESIAYPAATLPGLPRLGGTLSLLTFVVTLSLFYFQSTRRGASRFGLLAIAFGLLAPLASAAYGSWLISNPAHSLAAAQDFEPFRLLIALWLIALGIGLAVRLAAVQRGQVISSAGEVAWVGLAAIVAGLSLVSTTQDPNPLWPLAELSALALISALSSLASGQAWRGHLAAVAAAAGLCGWWLHFGGSHWFDEIWLLLWGPTWVALVSLSVQLFYPRISPTQDSQSDPNSIVNHPSRSHNQFVVRPFATVDQSVSLHVPIVSAILSLVWIALQPATLHAPTHLTWWKLALAVSVLLLACGRLWDTRPGKRGLSVYLSLLSLSLVAAVCLCSFGQLPRLQTWLMWMASGLGAMAIMAALLRELVRESSRLGPALKLSVIMGNTAKLRHALTWMPALHCAAGLLALVPSILLVLAFQERALRIAATALPFIGALAILPIAIERGKAVYRYCGLLLMSTALLLLWWADLPSAWALSGEHDIWIYLQRAFVALVAIGVVYPAVVVRLSRAREWEAPLMNCGWIAFWLGLGSGLVMLLLQLNVGWETQAASATLATKLMTALTWIAAVARLLQFAVWPHSTDQAASVMLRQAGVYAAQVGLALLCAAVYFHFPDLFSGVVARWWPLVVFAIAMLSAGLGQWLQRLGQTIVADPVRQSSLLLPLIPLAGVWWIQPEGAEWLWREWSRYWLLLLTASSLYGLHGWMRQSVALRTVSAGLALLSFWAFLHSQPNLRFLAHPQFWLLPPALATLIFVEVNRTRLTANVVNATRYLAILIAYFSSTAEIFLKAFEGQLWQPLLLLVLALLGVAAGIVLRVRAFLYCGTAFTLIALLGMVWHAQQAIGQVWPWWAFGICTGIGLIILLGYFEKNRSQVLVYLEHLKRWEK